MDSNEVVIGPYRISELKDGGGRSPWELRRNGEPVGRTSTYDEAYRFARFGWCGDLFGIVKPKDDIAMVVMVPSFQPDFPLEILHEMYRGDGIRKPFWSPKWSGKSFDLEPDTLLVLNAVNQAYTIREGDYRTMDVEVLSVGTWLSRT